MEAPEAGMISRRFPDDFSVALIYCHPHTYGESNWTLNLSPERIDLGNTLQERIEALPKLRARSREGVLKYLELCELGLQRAKDWDAPKLSRDFFDGLYSIVVEEDFFSLPRNVDIKRNVYVSGTPYFLARICANGRTKECITEMNNDSADNPPYRSFRRIWDFVCRVTMPPHVFPNEISLWRP